MDTTENNNQKASSKRKYRWLRRIMRIMLGILVFLFLIILFIRSPWGQNIIVDKVVDYVSGKTNTKITIDNLFITFDGDLQLDGLYLEDKKGDTLIYSKTLEANIPLWKTINGEAAGVEELNWEGLRANIIREDSISGYNFQFLIDAFATNDSTTVATDSSSAPINIIIGELELKDFDIVFNDAVLGVDSRYEIGEFEADMETFDIQKMEFNASEIGLYNSNIKVIQNKASADNNSDSESTLPKLSAEKLYIENVIAYYESKPQEIITDVNVGKFETEIKNIDLTKNAIIIEDLSLLESKVLVHLETKSNTLNEESSESTLNNSNPPFEWPSFQIEVASIFLEDNNLDFRVGNSRPVKNEFNPNAISINHLKLEADDIYLKDQSAGIILNELDFNNSNFNLDRLKFKLVVSEKQISLERLDLKLNNNIIQGYAELNYNGLTQLIEKPENTRVNVNFPNFRLSIKEVFKFQPQLEENPYLVALSEKNIYGNVNASGTLANLNIPNLDLNWGSDTKIKTKADLQNITNPEELQFNIPNLSAQTSSEDIIKFVDTTGMGISFPQKIELAANAAGSLDDLSGELVLNTSQGSGTFKGAYQNQEMIVYDANVIIDDYKLNELLNNQQLGTLTVSIQSNGQGTSINNMDASINATIDQFELNNYAINDLSIEGTLTDGNGHILSTYKDKNLNMNLDAFVVLDSIAPEVTAEIDVIGADLKALGVMAREVKTGMTIYADFKGNAKKYDASAIVKDGVFVYDNRTYLLGSLDALAHVRTDTTSISVRNKMLDLNLKSNSDPQTFGKALQKHVRSYFYRDSISVDSIGQPVNLKLKGKIAESPLLNEVFLVNAKDIDTISIDMDFKEKARELTANITAPHINYSGNEVDSLSFSMQTDRENFSFNLGFNNIIAGPLDIPKTKISGSQTDTELLLNFMGKHNDSLLMNLNATISGTSDRLVLKVNPDSLILNKETWKIPKENEIILTENNLEFNQFQLTKNRQLIALTHKLENIQKNHAALNFENFNLNELFNYLNPESKLASGKLNGELILEEPFNETGILADLNVDNLNILNTDFGTLSIEAKSLGERRYDFNANLTGGDINLDLTGDYIARDDDAELDLDVDITEFKMKALNSLSLGEIKNAEGTFKGNFKVTGSTKNPQYNGEINFNNARFNISKLNAAFTLQNETLKVDNSGLSMNDFTILDEKNNALVLSGKIGTESFINPTFNLDLKANDFHVLNSTKEDNELFYGVASFNADAKLTGDLQIPKLDAELTLSSDTDVTYVLPSAVADIEERDGVVIFVNRENPDAILTETEEVTATISGFDISTLIKIGEDATATIIIDENTGDNFKIKGQGELDFKMSPNGRMTLSGIYEISDGHYELSLYNLVKRKFNIAKGSRVSWSGNPFDAELDVRAIYEVETSASPLMSSAVSSSSTAERGKFRQKLPFLVYLNIDGELMQPEISFELDMPEEEQGAISGQVYGMVQQINNQESELNRQVFSLLALNRFYPNSGSDGSQGGIATVARDNLNDAVSSQLNAFSEKLLGDSGIELNFGLDSYTDYQGNSPTDRTQLDVEAQKKLFNDRLIVRVGSEVDIQGSNPNGQTAPLIGNASLEYVLSEDGRYRIKGFRKSEFENVIDGQTIISGIALIFTTEFNQFRDLWKAMFESTEDDEENTNQSSNDSATKNDPDNENNKN